MRPSRPLQLASRSHVAHVARVPNVLRRSISISGLQASSRALSIPQPLLQRAVWQLPKRLLPPSAAYKITGSELRVGQVVERKGKLWQVVKMVQITPGRRASIVQAEFKDLITGTKMNDRLRSEEKIDMVELENHKVEYLGPDSDGNLLFKDIQTFDEVKLKESDVDDKMRGWLKVGREFHIKRAEEVDMSVVVFPAKTTWAVQEISGNAAVLENGKRISVPHMIKVGDKISVKIPEEVYSHRVNSTDDEDEAPAEESEEQAEEEEQEEVAEEKPRKK